MKYIELKDGLLVKAESIDGLERTPVGTMVYLNGNSFFTDVNYESIVSTIRSVSEGNNERKFDQFYGG